MKMLCTYAARDGIRSMLHLAVKLSERKNEDNVERHLLTLRVL